VSQEADLVASSLRHPTVHPPTPALAADAPAGLSLHHLFEGHARRAPAATAVVLGQQAMSYGQLNRRANRLAHHLRTLGVGPEVLVGLCVERSVEMVVGVLAVLKAGGAYVPLDPAYPRERLAFMLEDSRVPVLLTQTHLVASLPAHPARVLCLDAPPPELGQQGDHDPVPLAGPDHLAYVIYTPGSTGRPWGVLVEHRGLSNLAEAQARLFAVQPDDCVLQLAPLAFDASVSELAMTFAAGATLVLGTREELVPGPRLLRLLEEQGITIVTLVPTALAALGPATPGVLPALRTIVVAGAACPAALAAQWAPGRRFFNAYGPTEATVCATVAACTGREETLPIGRAIDNVRLRVLDAYRQPVRPGEAGELYLGGAGLARGYLNRPELTRERFIADPFTRGARLYSTGDRVRALPDGDLELLGRRDHQLRIRGLRVEPGEIEVALAAHEAVREATVIAREDVPGDPRLVAYVVARPGAALEVGALPAYLGDKLPAHLVPSAFVCLESMPLTLDGRVDRRGLPHPDAA
jgi:amino acid adenylation domain-containing protein